MSENSTRWKNPEDIMKMHKIKKRKQSIPKIETKAKTKELFRDRTNLTNTQFFSQVNCKRKNPFSLQLVSSQSKRVRYETNGYSPKKISVKLNENIFTVLDSDNANGSEEHVFVEKDVIPKNTLQNETVVELDTGSSNDEHLLTRTVDTTTVKGKLKPEAVSSNEGNSSVKTTNPEQTDCHSQNVSERGESKFALLKVLPVDWSLKVKARVTSSSSLAWCTQFKTMHEAQSVRSFIHCAGQWKCEDDKTAFLSYCHYWVHPNLPWLKSFPRIVSDTKIIKYSPSLSTEVEQALQKDWSESFTSAFHLLRCEMCPYFYLCTHQFTVLFRAVDVLSGPSISALVSPTSRGFREALNNEGITYTMPNLDSCKQETGAHGDVTADTKTELTRELTRDIQSVSSVNESDALPDDETDLMHTDEGASIWLESMGLDKKDFPSLDPNKVKLQREGFRQVDNRPESLVCVTGQQVQALFNFLLNCRTCIASSGPQTGIPPTILAPLAFRGATLKTNVVKYSATKMLTSACQKKEQHILEISGPILPHHVLNLSALLRQTQENEVILTLKTHDSSAAFNINSNSSVNSGNSAVNSGNSAENSGNSAMNSGNSAVNSGKSAENSGNSVVNSGNSAVNNGNSAVNSGKSAVNSGKSAENRGNSAVNSGNKLDNKELHHETHALLDRSARNLETSELESDTSVNKVHHETHALLDRSARNLESSGLHSDTHALLDRSARNLESSGLHPDTHGLLGTSGCLEQMSAIKEVTCSKRGFTYVV